MQSVIVKSGRAGSPRSRLSDLSCEAPHHTCPERTGQRRHQQAGNGRILTPATGRSVFRRRRRRAPGLRIYPGRMR
jgi:hypothetical protein